MSGGGFTRALLRAWRAASDIRRFIQSSRGQIGGSRMGSTNGPFMKNLSLGGASLRAGSFSRSFPNIQQRETRRAVHGFFSDLIS